MNETHLHDSIRRAAGEAPVLSLLSGTSMQAREFTTVISSSKVFERPSFYRNTTLREDIATLCDKATVPEGAVMLNVVLKFFHAYVHDGSHEEQIEFGEIASLLTCFARHRSLNEPGDDVEAMNRMRNWSGALRCLADIPRAAFIAGRVMNAELMNASSSASPYLGVDIGAASGLLVLAGSVQAARNGFGSAVSCGFMLDPLAGERTADLLRAFDAGTIIPADPCRTGAYASLYGLPIHFVANESMALLQGGLTRDNCFSRYRALFSAVGPSLEHSVFLPQGVVAHCSEENMSALLTPDNHFQPPAGYESSGFYPQGLLLDGEIFPAHRIGQSFEN